MTNMVKIRLGEMKDLKDYLRILLDAFPDEDIESERDYFMKHTKEKEVFVAVVGNKVVGYITFDNKLWSRDTIFVDELAVDRGYRNKGIGKQLLDRVKDKAKKERVRRIFLDTEKTNRKAIKFYLKNGFKKSGYINDMHKERLRCVILSYKVRK